MLLDSQLMASELRDILLGLCCCHPAITFIERLQYLHI
ncbi:hypothetical protein D1AOALGA4SA_9939 [Olavius algarvensis Delta 1 endosymbiont]|nr:hypothetical protein D1AOALGA4SA_9939 [Olavius algarvensis Delta 1 endosymbiont]